MTRFLNIASGLAVLLTAMALGHIVLLHHVFVHSPGGAHRDPEFWTVMITAVVVEALTLRGAVLLLGRGR